MKNLSVALAISAVLVSGCSSSPKSADPAAASSAKPSAAPTEAKSAEETQKLIDQARGLMGLPPEQSDPDVTEQRDEWIVMDSEDRELGVIREDNLGLALLRRFVTNLIPQTYHLEIDGAPAATFAQNFNPFTFKLTVDFSPDQTRSLDRRLGLAAAVLLSAVEGRQR